MNQRYSRRVRLVGSASRASGFTLIEMLVVILIASILAGIMAPSWLGFQTVANLNAAQDAVLQAMRQAQEQALNRRQNWQVGFRETNAQVEWANFAPGGTPVWQLLHPSVRIAQDSTTLSQNAAIYFAEFNDKGGVSPPLGRLTLASRRGDQNRRCVVISTILGVLRKASNDDCASIQTE